MAVSGRAGLFDAEARTGSGEQGEKMAVTAALVKQLREKTGVGMMQCKSALKEAGGDVGAAEKLLRKKGEATAQKKAEHSANSPPASGIACSGRGSATRGQP